LPDGNGLGTADDPFGDHLEAEPHEAAERQAPSLHRPSLQSNRFKAAHVIFHGMEILPDVMVDVLPTYRL